MGKTRHIAIALRIDEPYPHHQLVFEGIQLYAREHPNWRCLIDEHPGYHPRQRGKQYVRYDGVIARADPAMQQRLRRMGIPLVNVHYQNARPGLPGVYSDPVAMGRLAAEHLVERGFRRLCVLNDPSHKHSIEINRGFLERAAEDGCAQCTLVAMPEQSYEEPSYWIRLEKLFAEKLDAFEPPIGVFVETAPHARLLMQLSQARGWHIPHDLAVLCQHDLQAVVDVSPQISSVQMNHRKVGYEAGRLLDQLLDGVPAPDRPVLVPPVGVTGRESTDYFAVSDSVVAEALQLISGRLDRKLRLDDIAYELAVSPSLLKKKFAASLGRGVGQEIRRLRLAVAKRMLVVPDTPIAEIARQSGFQSSDVMNQVFRREVGVTPREYRKRSLSLA